MPRIRIQPGTWRASANKHIMEIVAEVGTDDLDLLEAAIRKNYPFGERAYWPYKVWLTEVKAVMDFLRYNKDKPVPTTPEAIKNWWTSTKDK